MATDLYLIRKNQTWTKYSQVEDVKLTSSLTGQSILGVTGSVALQRIQFPTGVTPPQAGTAIVFTAILPLSGTGVSVGAVYYIGAVTGNSVALYADAALQVPVQILANITTATIFIMAATDELRVWSGEYRDIFSTVQELTMSGTFGGGFDSQCQMTAQIPSTAIRNSVPGLIEGGQHELGFKPPSAANSDWPIASIPECQAPKIYYGKQYDAWISSKPNLTSRSDELAHANLRQSLINRTHWKFDRGATALPRYLYATWLDGDIIADNPPETT